MKPYALAYVKYIKYDMAQKRRWCRQPLFSWHNINITLANEIVKSAETTVISAATAAIFEKKKKQKKKKKKKDSISQ